MYALDGKADGFAACFGGAAIGGFHDAGTAAGTDDKAARTRAESHGPGGDTVRELAGFFVVAGHFEQAFGAMDGGAMFYSIGGFDFVRGDVFEAMVTREGQVARKNAGGAEDDDGVGDALFFELHVRVNVFGENTQRASGSALEKFGIFVRRFGRVAGFEFG